MPKFQKGINPNRGQHNLDRGETAAASRKTQWVEFTCEQSTPTHHFPAGSKFEVELLPTKDGKGAMPELYQGYIDSKVCKTVSAPKA